VEDPERFLARWSNLKKEAARKQQVNKPDPVEPAELPRALDDAAPMAKASAEGRAVKDGGGTPADPAPLPSIESITAESDIRAFLQSGVPRDLAIAALRRAWVTDPAIRDFIGIAENQWDFTDPAAIPGFGPLHAGDDARKLVLQAMGELEGASPAPEGTSSDVTLASSGNSEKAMAPAPLQQEAGGLLEDYQEKQSVPASSAASQQEVAEIKPVGARRKHGRALPRIRT
jgi:hypothetical protein